MAKKNVHEIRGKIYWAKVLGDPVMNYGGDGREWTFDLSPDDAGMDTLKELDLQERIKNKGDDRGEFIAFRQKEKRLDGSLNRRISVVDSEGNPWPESRKLGNGSVVDVRFEFKDYGKGKFPGLYPQGIRVLDYQEYTPVVFAPLSDDDPYARKANEEGRLPDGMEPNVGEEEFPE